MDSDAPVSARGRSILVLTNFVTGGNGNGVIGFNEIQFFDGKWEIEGRDPRGKTVRIDVDALTGAVLKLDRY